MRWIVKVAGVAMSAWVLLASAGAWLQVAEGNGEGSSLAGSIIKVAGVAIFAWGMYKMMSGKSSSDYYTLHYSGNDINQNQKGGAGCIIRNKEGKLVIAATYNLNHLYPDQYNIAVAEAMALSKGLKLAETKSLKLVRVVGDNKEVIDRVQSLEKKGPRVPLLSEIVFQIQQALQVHSIDPRTDQVKRIGRDENEVANELASLGSKLGGYKEESYYGPNDVPSKLDRLIREDENYFKGSY